MRLLTGGDRYRSRDEDAEGQRTQILNPEDRVGEEGAPDDGYDGRQGQRQERQSTDDPEQDRRPLEHPFRRRRTVHQLRMRV